METDWGAYLLLLTVAYVVPGPDFLLVLGWSTRHRRAGVLAGLGAQTGLTVHVLASVLGVSVLVDRWPASILVVQVAGAVYLVWLGVQTARAPTTTARDTARQAGDRAGGTAFRQGLGTNLLNPKAVVFVTSLLPQFADGTLPLPVQLVVLGAVDVAFGLGVWAVLVVVGQRLGGHLERPDVRRRWQQANGLVLVAIGLALGLAHVG